MNKVMRWCDRCRRRFYDETAAFCPFDGQRLDAPDDPHERDANLGTTLFGQFQLLEAIGRGAMGTVYRAWQSGMERPVAVKVLHPELARDDIFRLRFLREARAAARLAHPNIVGVHVVGETDTGVPFLVMEHLDGETLDDTLQREGTLDERRALGIARQIACALSGAHAGGVIHRDLKPANIILVRRQRGGDLVKMLDFGIAKFLDASVFGDGAVPLTREGVVFGTPHYIAPEQAQGGAIDGRADIYSLGVLLYRMLSGRLPFDGSAVAVLVAHIGREVPSLREIAPGVDARVAALVMRCLAKDPRDRFATADDVAAALEALETREAPISVVEHEDARTRNVAVDDVRAWRHQATSWRPVRLRSHPRAGRGRAVAALVAAALVSSGAGTGVVKLLRDRSTPAQAADEAPVPDVTDEADLAIPAGSSPDLPISIDGAPVGRSVVLSDGAYSMRASLPDVMPAGLASAVLLDVWDPAGRPLTAPFLGVSQPTGDTTRARATDVPGRYRLDVLVAEPGTSVFHVDLPGGGVVHLHLPIAETSEHPAS